MFRLVELLYFVERNGSVRTFFELVVTFFYFIGVMLNCNKIYYANRKVNSGDCVFS